MPVVAFIVIVDESMETFVLVPVLLIIQFDGINGPANPVEKVNTLICWYLKLFIIADEFTIESFHLKYLNKVFCFKYKLTDPDDGVTVELSFLLVKYTKVASV